MNYFELFDMAPTMSIDRNELRKKYLALSRKYHPDYFAQSTKAEMEEALEKTAMLNKAFKTLGNNDSTIKYLLQEEGLLEEEEKYSLPSTFLMEMLELNEAVEEASGEQLVAETKNKLEQIETELYAAVAPVINNYKQGVTATEDLLLVKDYYFKKKYLLRLRSLLDGKL